ncbi:hypothetical protein PTKIN_Ptkin10aG0072300 [Pterospermum kingtungense]
MEEKSKTGNLLDWKKLFEVLTDQAISIYEGKRQIMIDEVTRVFPPIALLDEGEKNYETSLIAQFLGKIPNFSAFQKTLNLLWGKGKDVDLKPVGQNLFVIKFDSVVECDRVLEDISYIASAIGTPLYTDKFTALQQRLVFVKVCIEVELVLRFQMRLKWLCTVGRFEKLREELSLDEVMQDVDVLEQDDK